MAIDARKKRKSSGLAKRRVVAREVQREQYGNRRAELREISSKLFKEKGFRNVSLEDIGKAAGLNRASVYYYASSKEELYFDVALSSLTIFADKAEEIAESGGTFREKLDAFIVAMMDHYQKNFPDMYIFVQEVVQESDRQPALSKDMKAISDRIDNILFRIISDGVVEGEVRPNISPRLMAFGILGMVNWSYRWFTPSGSLSAAEIGRQFAEMILQGALIERD